MTRKRTASVVRGSSTSRWSNATPPNRTRITRMNTGLKAPTRVSIPLWVIVALLAYLVFFFTVIV